MNCHGMNQVDDWVGKKLLKAGLSVLGVCIVIAVMVMFSGCANLGLMAKVQQADEAYAVKLGVPGGAATVAKVRGFLGIPDARTIPAADRVLPVPATWYYDVLDKNEAVVDTEGFHFGKIPRIRLNAPAINPVNVVNPVAPVAPAEVDAAGLEAILKLMATLPKAPVTP